MAFSTMQNSFMHHQKQFDKELLHFSHSLVPADEDSSDAKEVANNIFLTLQKNGKFKIDRLGIMGSVAKKTALASEFDMDCVIFINDITTNDFPNVFKHFEQILKMNESLSAGEFRAPKSKGVALQATVNGFKFDIVPAINYSQDPEVQRSRVLDEIRKLQHPSKDGYRLNSSLIYDQVNFIKKQTPFTHDIIRLAKFWNRSIFIEEYVSGRSTMIELIAVDAAAKVDSIYQYKSHVQAFREFLHSMRDLQKVRITFDHSRIEDYILRQKPLVLDPINPYNNFAYDLSRDYKARLKFEQFACGTLLRLNGEDLCLLFLFQVPPLSFNLNLRADRKWIVDVYDNVDRRSKRIKVIKRNAGVNHLAAEMYKYFFSCNMRILKSDCQTKEELQSQVQKSLDQFHTNKQRWEDSHERHEDRDVTYQIPSGDGRFIVHCSCTL